MKMLIRRTERLWILVTYFEIIINFIIQTFKPALVMKKIILSSTAFLMLTIILLISQISCKKETTSGNNCTPTIVGLWTGSWQNATTGGAFSWSIRPDGTISSESTFSGTRQLVDGTWTLSGSTLTMNTICIYGPADHIGTTQTFTATYNSTTGALTNGTFQNISPNHDSGTFTLTEAK